MIDPSAILTILSGLLFLWYGSSSLFADGMVDDFARFGLSRYRRLTGGLELLGAIGLLASLVVRPLVVVSAGGLALLMLLGVITRVRVRDPWLSVAPALLLMLLNGWLAVRTMTPPALAIGTLLSHVG
jgi:DoxX-like family